MTDADRGEKGEPGDRRARRGDLLAAVLQAFPVELESPFGREARRYGKLFENDSLDELQAMFTGRMGSAIRAWYEILDRAVKPHGLSLRHWQALFVLAVDDAGATLTSIAARVGVPNPTLVRILDDLEGAGLIARKIDQKDRRSKRIDLTPMGEETFAALFAANQELRRRFLQGLSQSELQLMAEAADIMNRNLAGMMADFE